MKQVLIIGGGASGLFLSALLDEHRFKVTILEKEDRVGKKLVRTGNGKCNFTNKDLSLSHFHGEKSIIENVVKEFPLEETLKKFEELGILHSEDDEGRIYPRSLQAHAVLDAVRFRAEESGVLIETGKEVCEAEMKNGRFSVGCRDGSAYSSDILVISTGGKAGLAKHSDSMYRIAENFGHNVRETFPSLVQLTLTGRTHIQTSGMRWHSGITLYEDGKPTANSKGDVLFTDYGVSGDAVLNISRKAVESVMKRRKTEIGIDLLPEMNIEETRKFLDKRISEFHERKIEHFFTGVINKKIGRTLLQSMGILLNDRIESLLTRSGEIAENIHDWKFEVKGHSGWANAQVTAGGVDLDGVNPITLESLVRPGLFFTGEILDVDGDCGGYNLQWAWSSAHAVSSSINKLTKIVS